MPVKPAAVFVPSALGASLLPAAVFGAADSSLAMGGLVFPGPLAVGALLDVKFGLYLGF